MHLESQIVIRRRPADILRFLGTVDNVVKWDRGVVRTVTTKTTPTGVGTEFSTFARADSDWGKMSYRIVASGPDYWELQLISRDGNARFFRKGCWTSRTEPHPEGTLFKCCVDFTLRYRYLFIAPFLWAKRSAISVDLELLKRAIENEPTMNATS